MAEQQKKEKKEELKQVYHNLKNAPSNQPPVEEADQSTKIQKSNLLNISLEAIANFNYQEKLQRDRIGIIFQKAKTRSWDAYRDYYKEIRGKKNAKQLMDQFVVKNVTERGSGNPSKQQHPYGNQMALNLRQDDCLSSNNKLNTPGRVPPKNGDYNELFENKIFEDEREFVNYNQMFLDLPIADLQEVDNNQEEGGVTPAPQDAGANHMATPGEHQVEK